MKITRTTLIVWIAGMMLTAIVSCQSETVTSASANTDSIRVSANSTGVEVSVYADFPTKNTSPLLATAIAEYINEELGGTYEGDVNMGDSLLQFYANQQGDFLKSEYKELKSIRSDVPSLLYTASAKKVAETDKYISLTTTTESYLGGAHGSMTISGVTIRKSDGRRLGWEIFHNTMSDDFNKLLKEGLMRYFSDQGHPAPTDEDLTTALMVEDVNHLPLPQSAPYMTPEGMVFTYQQYEIACYAAGMPSFTIPYHKLEPFLAISAKQLYR